MTWLAAYAPSASCALRLATSERTAPAVRRVCTFRGCSGLIVEARQDSYDDRRYVLVTMAMSLSSPSRPAVS